MLSGIISFMVRRVVLDCETDNVNPEKVKVVHCVVAKELNSTKAHLFRTGEELNEYLREGDILIGHNIIEYDMVVLRRLWFLGHFQTVDTLILSRLDDVRREGGHSLENWGALLNHPKVQHDEWHVYSEAMRHRCEEDVHLTEKVYLKLWDQWKKEGSVHKIHKAIAVEHEMAMLCQEMHRNGFKFNHDAAQKLYLEINKQVQQLDEEIQEAFPPTIKKMKRVEDKIIPFNPRSSKQVIDRIHEFWEPTEKTKGHLDAERGDHRKLRHFKKYGWKLSETNFATLSEGAPKAAHLLVRRNLLATRLSKLEEWFGAYSEKDGRIHGTIISLGTYTHRMVHLAPNMANIAAEKSIKYKSQELKELATRLGKEMRSLFTCEENCYLVGVDLAGIQLRVLADYVNDRAFTKSIIEGKKEDGTDVHSINRDTIALPTVDRDSAKTFIYAWCLGAGLPKIASIFGVKNISEAEAARERFTSKYQGLARLKAERIKQDAKRGFFIGFDGRPIRITDEHHMLAGYLQAGEAVIMKQAVIYAVKEIGDKFPAKLINIVHDEVLFEVEGRENAEKVKEIIERSMTQAGKELMPKVLVEGEGKIGKTWLDVH